MSKASIHFRTRGGPNHGWGNIHRLADFAGRCRDLGHDGIRFFAEGPSAVTDYLRSLDFETIALQEDISIEDERAILKSHPKASVLISEMLECTPALQALLGDYADKLVVFDDLLDHRYDADLVFCAQALPEYGNIEVSTSRTKFLTGYEYFMFGPAFQEFENCERSYSEKIETVLVAFGGGRYDGAYIKSARTIAGMSPSIQATFVLGFAAEENLTNELADILPNANILGGIDNIAELMATMDLAILSAGYLKLEAAITGTPAVLVATQWHQILLAEEFVKRTGAPFVGYMGFVTTASILRAVTSLESSEARRKLSERASGVVDTAGFERVYEAIFGEVA